MLFFGLGGFSVWVPGIVPEFIGCKEGNISIPNAINPKLKIADLGAIL
jgi:hypothetical protein